MKKCYEDYIERSREIRRLSMPPEEGEKSAGEFYHLFNENFGKIKILLNENKTILDKEVYRPMKNPKRLTKEKHFLSP